MSASEAVRLYSCLATSCVRNRCSYLATRKKKTWLAFSAGTIAPRGHQQGQLIPMPFCCTGAHSDRKLSFIMSLNWCRLSQYQGPHHRMLQRILWCRCIWILAEDLFNLFYVFLFFFWWSVLCWNFLCWPTYTSEQC